MGSKEAFHAYFSWKPNRVDELQEENGAGPYQVNIVKQIELTQAQYQHFSTHLWLDMPFIVANKDLMGCDEENTVSHCLLVTSRERRDGILVDCQGFDYARYAAYIHDKSMLDLRDVPVDHYDLKLRQPRERQEQR